MKGLPALTLRRRWLVRMGLAVMLALLGISAFWAYQIQVSLSESAAGVYRLHIRQDEALQRIRRAVWQSSVLVRDFLLSDLPDRRERLLQALTQQRGDSAAAERELHDQSIPDRDLHRLSSRLEEFWAAMALVPEATEALSPGGRYRFVEDEISSRRRALSQLLQEVTAVSRQSLEAGERRLHQTLQEAGRRLGWVVALVFAVGIAFAGVGLRRISRLEVQSTRQYEEVAATKTELQALSAQLMSLQEAERASLSRELHDEIGQQLATLRLELARLESSARSELPDIHARLARARGIVDGTVKAVRNISLMLRPSLLDDLGLADAIQWLAEDFSRRTGLPCRVREENVSDDLPMDFRTCIFRIAQEALHNVEKHAGASSVGVLIAQDATGLCLCIEDDGRGAGLAGREPGAPRLGILGMRERAMALGGRFALVPALPRGTRVEVRLPLVPTALPAADDHVALAQAKPGGREGVAS